MKPIYPGYDIPSYHERLTKTISRYGLPKGAPHAFFGDPDRRAWNYLYYMQPSAAMYWQCYLYAALQAVAIDQHPELSTITILDKRWHFGERHWNFAPGKMIYRVRRALKGLNYLVVIEFEIFRNVRHLASPAPGSVAAHADHGRVITPHIQGFTWGQRPSRSQRANFEGGFLDATGVKIVRVHDFPGAIRYMGKPCMGRSVYQRLDGTFGRRPWSNMSLTLHYLMLSNLSWYSWPDLTFAGGEGRPILAHARRLWRNYKPGATHPTDHRPPLFSGLVWRPKC